MDAFPSKLRALCPQLLEICKGFSRNGRIGISAWTVSRDPGDRKTFSRSGKNGNRGRLRVGMRPLSSRGGSVLRPSHPRNWNRPRGGPCDLLGFPESWGSRNPRRRRRAPERCQSQVMPARDYFGPGDFYSLIKLPPLISHGAPIPGSLHPKGLGSSNSFDPDVGDHQAAARS